MIKHTLLHVGLLHPHPANVREELGDLTELAASIKAHGILQPLTVVHHPEQRGHFLVIAGHRRLAAAKRARLNDVPVLIRDEAVAEHATEIMLIENCHRRGLNPMERAEAMGDLRRQGLTSAEISRRTGMTDATVSQYLALLELDKASQDKVRNRELATADAVAAVRKVRARRRKAAGQKPNATALTWEPDHFTRSHPLARKAAALCDAREHNLRRRIGKVACGQCWETAIRADEQVAAEALVSAGAA